MRQSTPQQSIRRVLALLVALGLGLGVLPARVAAQAPAPAGVSAPAPAVGSGLEARIDSARAILKAHREARGIPGLTAAVAVDGEVVWTEGFGHANLQHRVPAAPETLYRIASISKPVAAVGAMQLVERGRLDLDAPIQRYLPDFPRKRGTVTTRQLMSHTAGIRHYRGREFLSNVRYTNVFDPMEVFQDDSLLFAPGEKYSYTTYGYTVVSAVVARAAGQPFLDYIEENIIRPLNLQDLQPEHRDSIIPHHASFYEREDGRLVNAPCVDLSNKWAGGGYISTSADLVRFASALMEGRLLEPETREAMFMPQHLNNGKTIGYALGWRVGEDNGRRVVWHTGGAVGGSGVLLFYPDDGVAVAILANLSGGGHTDPARQIARLFVAAPVPTQGALGATPADALAR